jgi:hypothetical protein
MIWTYFFGDFFLPISYSTLLHLPPLRFHTVKGYRDRTQDCCDFDIASQTLLQLGWICKVKLNILFASYIQ